MKQIFISDLLEVQETGQDYDFIAVLTNRTPESVTVEFSDPFIEFEPMTIAGDDWVGILANLEGRLLLNTIRAGRLSVRKGEKI